MSENHVSAGVSYLRCLASGKFYMGQTEFQVRKRKRKNLNPGEKV